MKKDDRIKLFVCGLIIIALICLPLFSACKSNAEKQGIQGEQGDSGLSSYELFMFEYPDYSGNQTQWVIDLANGQLLRTVTFKASGNDDVVFTVLYGSTFTDIPEVPFKENYSGTWDIGEASLVNITSNIIISASYINEIPIQNPVPGMPNFPQI